MMWKLSWWTGSLSLQVVLFSKVKRQGRIFCSRLRGVTFNFAMNWNMMRCLQLQASIAGVMWTHSVWALLQHNMRIKDSINESVYKKSGRELKYTRHKEATPIRHFDYDVAHHYPPLFSTSCDPGILSLLNEMKSSSKHSGLWCFKDTQICLSMFFFFFFLWITNHMAFPSSNCYRLITENERKSCPPCLVQ